MCLVHLWKQWCFNYEGMLDKITCPSPLAYDLERLLRIHPLLQKEVFSVCHLAVDSDGQWSGGQVSARHFSALALKAMLLLSHIKSAVQVSVNPQGCGFIILHQTTCCFSHYRWDLRRGEAGVDDDVAVLAWSDGCQGLAQPPRHHLDLYRHRLSPSEHVCV